MDIKGELTTVGLSFEDTIKIVREGVLNEGVSTRIVDEYGDNQNFHLLVFDKYYMRASNRVSLTVHIAKDSGMTRVYAVGSGGGEGAIFSFDWGAADKFASVVGDILRQY